MRKFWVEEDVLSGVMFTALGVGVAAIARTYPLGSADQMGPGYFPMLLGLGLAAIGVVLTVRSLLARPGSAASFHFRSLTLITSSIVAFGLLLQTLGLAVATVALVAISALAAWHRRAWQAVALSVGLAAFACAVFIYGLGLQIPLWPT